MRDKQLRMTAHMTQTPSNRLDRRRASLDLLATILTPAAGALTFAVLL